MEERKIENIMEQVNVSMYLNMKLDAWKMKLAYECNVFVLGKRYLARRYDKINFSIVSESEARTILVDNVNALLKYKYLTITSDESRKKIEEITKVMKSNIKTNLIKVGDKANGFNLHELPNGCIAFKNGVYDFKNNNWLFTYDTIDIPSLHDKIIFYNGYMIKWYFNIDFKPFDFSIMEKPFNVFLKEQRRTKDISSVMKVFCNYAHNNADKLSMEKAVHLSEVMGHLVQQKFTNNVCFVNMNSQHSHILLDKFFTPYIVPKPSDFTLSYIERNKIAKDYLQQHSQNISYEYGDYATGRLSVITELTNDEMQNIDKQYKESDIQPINNHMLFCIGKNGDLNVSEDSPMLDRLNIFDLNYRFSYHNQYLKTNDCYYDMRNLSITLNDIIIFIYISMYGLRSATRDFTRDFKFTYNDFTGILSQKVNTLGEQLKNIKMDDFLQKIALDEDLKVVLYDTKYIERLFRSESMHAFYKRKWTNVSNLKTMLQTPRYYNAFFANKKEVFIRINFIYDYLGYTTSRKEFTRMIRKLYPTSDMRKIDNNRMYIRAYFENGLLKIIN